MANSMLEKPIEPMPASIPGNNTARSIVPWVIVAVVALLAIAMVTTAVASMRVAGRAVMPDTITISGIIMLTDDSGFTGHTLGSSCYGDGGYDDLVSGASVTVYDSGDAIIGRGNIDASNFNGSSCVLSFEISKIPSGKGFYQVEVSHRGKISADETDLENGTLYFIGEIG